MYLKLSLILLFLLLLGCSSERITEQPVNTCPNDGKVVPKTCEGRHQLIVTVYENCESRTELIFCGQDKICKDGACVSKN